MDSSKTLHTIQFLFFVSVFGLNTCYALPEDWKPRATLNFQQTSLFKIFNGKGLQGQSNKLTDLQEVKIINDDYALISSRNHIYVVDLKTISDEDNDVKFSQVIQWLPENVTTCTLKADGKRRCENYIRVLASMSGNNYLICGTNALKPKCREYKWNGTQFTSYIGGNRYTDTNKCPLDDEPSLAYVYSGGNLYTATRINYRQDPTVRRTPVDGRMPQADFEPNMSSGSQVVRDEPLPHLSTDNNEASLLNDPVFVAAMETSEKVFVFFREIATESFGNGDITFSRVAQVCKNDKGGSKNYRAHKWTSYFKARLNCSAPGSKPFYFNELRHLSREVVINGVTTVFAVMTTPEDSIWGSAVCAYTVPAIEKAMTGDFRKHSTFDAASECWSKTGQKPPYGLHPTVCPSQYEDTRSLPNNDLQFRRNHPLMAASVQPITDIPLFMRTQSRYIFSAIDVELEPSVEDSSQLISILYIGTNDGHLLTVVPYPYDTDDRYDNRKKRGDGAFVQELEVYNPRECASPSGKSSPTSEGSVPIEGSENADDAKRVVSITAVKGRDLLLVAFRNCIISVPKKLCALHNCRKKCVQSGNPYCGWLDGSCVIMTEENKNKIEQDLFAERTDLPECTGFTDFETSPTSPYVKVNECSAASSFAVPLSISMSVCFFVVLIVFLVVMKCQHRLCGSCRRSRRNKALASLDQDFNTANNSSNKRPIYKGPRSASITVSNSFATRRPVIAKPSNASSYVGYNLEETSESSNALDTRDPPSRNMYASVASVTNSFTSDSHHGNSVTSLEDVERRKFHGVNIVEDVRPSSDRVVDNQSLGSETNLNNNNTKKTIGVAIAMTHADSPLRRRKQSFGDVVDRPSTPTTTRIRMGSLSGTCAVGRINSPNHTWKPQHPRIVTNPNFMAVSPMPNNVLRSVSQDSESKSVNVDSDEDRRKSCGGLPKPPVSGLAGRCLSSKEKMVSGYSEITNAQNHIFGRQSNSPEPEYENTRMLPQNSEHIKPSPPTPPPANLKPGRKLSSFTTSHFNTSWFPANCSRSYKNGMISNLEETKALKDTQDIRSSSSSSGVMSSSSSASGGNICPENYPETSEKNRAGRRKGQACRKDMIVAKGLLSAQVMLDQHPKKNHLSDDGYGSGTVSNHLKKRDCEDIPEYQNIPGSGTVGKQRNRAASADYLGKDSSSDEECIIKELGEINWDRQKKDSKKKSSLSSNETSRKKKAIKKGKKNADKRGLVVDLSSPSDSDNVFYDVPPISMIDFDTEDGDRDAFVDECSWQRENNISCRQALDDSFVETCREDSVNNSPSSKYQYAFHTMRPPGRMRQKLPRLRCGEKECDATLIPVPTPEIPML